jgi:predicted protein tyrosine phosphatase
MVSWTASSKAGFEKAAAREKESRPAATAAAAKTPVDLEELVCDDCVVVREREEKNRLL